MMNIKHILFPVDFTESSQKIVSYVKQFVQACNAQLSLIHVVRGPEDFAGFELGAAWWTSIQKEVMDGANQAMEQFVNDNLADVPNVKTFVTIGDIVEEVVSYANANKIDLILIGTHGRKGLEKAMFGSVAEGVVKAAPCPVLTINPYKIKP
ncbi:MAG: universal stress protein [Dissulfuribacterales bacterium]